jgi:hypothetical protein
MVGYSVVPWVELLVELMVARRDDLMAVRRAAWLEMQ